jgi:hypothetical protein
LAPPFGGEPRERQEFPGVPEWLDLNIIVPVSATVVVVCVGILVVCVALSRKKQPPMMNPGFFLYGFLKKLVQRRTHLRKRIFFYH